MTDGGLTTADLDLARKPLQSPAGILFEPPIVVEVENVQEREARLARVIADQVILRLLTLRHAIKADETGTPTHVAEVEVAKLSQLVVGPDNSDALD